jgi:hypothetical protein
MYTGQMEYAHKLVVHAGSRQRDGSVGRNTAQSPSSVPVNQLNKLLTGKLVKTSKRSGELVQLLFAKYDETACILGLT